MIYMKREYPKHPISAVGVVVFKGNDVLLIKRNKPPKSNEWSIPGGAQDLGEKLKDTAKREVLEESGITIGQISLVDVVDYLQKDEDGLIQFHYSLIDFSASYVSGELKPDDDAIDAKWVPIDTLEEYNLWSETITLIIKAANQRQN